jgi:hypothetical protein
LKEGYSEGNGQEIYLKCPVCGARYRFENDMLILEECYKLKKLSNYSCITKDLELEDYSYKIQSWSKVYFIKIKENTYGKVY